MKQLPNLYALRFILCLFVILQHIPDTSKSIGLPYFHDAAMLHKGGLAVFYFFTLSGFLIIRIIYLEIKTTQAFNFKHFYMRRIQRLYPIYYLVLFFGSAFYNFILPYFNIQYDGDYPWGTFFAGYIFLVPNVITYYYKVGGILNVLWSIGVEEQFYLFAPLLIYIGRKNILLTLFLMLISLIGLHVFFTDLYIYKNYYFYFVCGGVFAVFFEKFKGAFFYNRILHIIVYSLFIVSFLSNYFDSSFGKYIHYFNMLLSALLISLISYYPLGIVKNNSINYFGKISYGIYMYHMIALYIILYMFKKIHLDSYFNDIISIVFINTLCISASIFISHMSFKYFEKLFYKPKF